MWKTQDFSLSTVWMSLKHASALDNAAIVWEPLSHKQEPRLSHHCSIEVLLSTLPERGARGEDEYGTDW